MYTELIDRNQIPDNANHEPNPPNRRMLREGAEHARAQKDKVAHDSHKQIRSRQTRQQGQIYQGERVRYEPVHVAQPEDLAEVVVCCVRDVFVGFQDGLVLVGDALSGG